MNRATEVVAEDLEPLLTLFRILSDRTRLNLLMILARGERNVSSLCDELRLPQPTVSHHLGLLRRSNLITSHRDGRQVFYQLKAGLEALSGEGLEFTAAPFVVRIGEAAGA